MKFQISKNKICSWLAIFLWVLSIVLSFMISKESPLICLPDTVLLLGFVPLLILCRFSIVWILFGLFTASIGLALQIIEYVPDQALPIETHEIKHHLAQYHPVWSWMILGSIVFIYGSFRLLINIALFFIAKLKAAK